MATSMGEYLSSKEEFFTVEKNSLSESSEENPSKVTLRFLKHLLRVFSDILGSSCCWVWRESSLCWNHSK